MFSPAQMSALQDLVELGMATEVSILRREVVDREDGDSFEVWIETQSVKGWIWEPPTIPSVGEIGGVVGTVTGYRLYVPIGVHIEPGDRVGAEGALYTVTNTNSGNTYQPMVRAAMRQLE